MALHRQNTLNTGAKVDLIGYGTWQSAPGEVGPAVAEAIKIGYRHIDCALVYENQPEVAEGIKEGLKAVGENREDLFIVSKLWCNSARPSDVEADLDLTLSQLDTPYLDCYLIHWPVTFAAGKTLQPIEPGSNPTVRHIDHDAPGIVATWKELVRIFQETKKVRAIGVSNFTVEQLEKIIDATGVIPAMNQIECHPGLPQPELFEYFCIAWCAHQGFCVIPKSVTPSRIKANFEDFTLSDQEFEEISAIGHSNSVRGNIPAKYNPPWPVDIFGTEEEKGLKKVW
ncbi:hypothetical protein TREMEDRAFT_69577 [Tremella mesenterica DSM 1558]|uniref:uncharacterized protein n=1 Tax=Tremella mesenterica (strain ATCC 24925 / CBS 8224 / DSM 1558 / NBRC 9311 / NRRL Y-6157 / RJB 2259-6 / UBC 559-6) TaxID=578456 RepID=UPI0003F4A240|nr:uncharacterized protein TREMEDRAFT_69577 [Tremella mesenterica DSM 1558]EIW68113.1 hypothetical protein TREMEDRAFT_69577 [Tremella mesenterica DSM 1558]